VYPDPRGREGGRIYLFNPFRYTLSLSQVDLEVCQGLGPAPFHPPSLEFRIHKVYELIQAPLQKEARKANLLISLLIETISNIKRNE
jgi:hypothetical protein